MVAGMVASLRDCAAPPRKAFAAWSAPPGVRVSSAALAISPRLVPPRPWRRPARRAAARPELRELRERPRAAARACRLARGPASTRRAALDAGPAARPGAGLHGLAQVASESPRRAPPGAPSTARPAAGRESPRLVFSRNFSARGGGRPALPGRGPEAEPHRQGSRQAQAGRGSRGTEAAQAGAGRRRQAQAGRGRRKQAQAGRQRGRESESTGSWGRRRARGGAAAPGGALRGRERRRRERERKKRHPWAVCGR